MPADAVAAVRGATTRSAAVAAAVENFRAVRSQAEGVKGRGYQPRVEARLRGGAGRNFDGVEDQKREINGAIVLNWNLYNGGSDQARVRQYVNLINQAADLRDKACRDARQTAAIAYNDVVKLRDQIESLRRNEGAISKARDAYRQQFDIGQRSLLDLLNAQGLQLDTLSMGMSDDLEAAVAEGATLDFGLNAGDYATARAMAGAITQNPVGIGYKVVEYALSRTLSPALVAQYQTQLPDKRLLAPSS